MNGQACYYLASAIVGIALGAATLAANTGQDQDRSIVCDEPGCGERTIELACNRPDCEEQTIQLACDRPGCQDDQTVPKTV